MFSLFYAINPSACCIGSWHSAANGHITVHICCWAMIHVLFLCQHSKAKSTLPSSVSIFLFCARNRKMETKSVQQRIPAASIDHNRVRQVCVTLSVILTEKTAQHAAFFSLLKRRKAQMEPPNGGLMACGLSLSRFQSLPSWRIIVTITVLAGQYPNECAAGDATWSSRSQAEQHHLVYRKPTDIKYWWFKISS